MPTKSGSQKRKEKFKNNLELKKIQGSFDKFIQPRTNRKYLYKIYNSNI